LKKPKDIATPTRVFLKSGSTMFYPPAKHPRARAISLEDPSESRPKGTFANVRQYLLGGPSSPARCNGHQVEDNSRGNTPTARVFDCIVATIETPAKLTGIHYPDSDSLTSSSPSSNSERRALPTHVPIYYAGPRIIRPSQKFVLISLYILTFMSSQVVRKQAWDSNDRVVLKGTGAKPGSGTARFINLLPYWMVVVVWILSLFALDRCTFHVHPQAMRNHQEPVTKPPCGVCGKRTGYLFWIGFLVYCAVLVYICFWVQMGSIWINISSLAYPQDATSSIFTDFSWSNYFPHV